MSQQLSGFRAWVWQRLSALYLLGFIIYLLAYLLASPPDNYSELRAWLGSRPVWLAGALFIPALLVHAWVGMRDVMLDYLPSAGARLLGLALLLLFVTATGLWALALWVSLL